MLSTIYGPTNVSSCGLCLDNIQSNADMLTCSTPKSQLHARGHRWPMSWARTGKEVTAEQEKCEKMIRDQNYSMKGTNSGWSGDFIVLTVSFTSVLCMF